MSAALARYESFLVNNVSTISTVESSLRSITWLLPGRFKDAELASEARQSFLLPRLRPTDVLRPPRTRLMQYRPCSMLQVSITIPSSPASLSPTRGISPSCPPRPIHASREHGRRRSRSTDGLPAVSRSSSLSSSSWRWASADESPPRHAGAVSSSSRP